MSAIEAVRHTGIVVNDLEKAISFYQDLLGLKIVKRKEETGKFIDKITGLKNVTATTVKMAAADGALVELLRFSSHPDNVSASSKITTTGITHLAFTVGDLDSLYQKLKEQGVIFVSQPQVAPNKFAKVVFCQDPEGNLLELAQEL